MRVVGVAKRTRITGELCQFIRVHRSNAFEPRPQRIADRDTQHRPAKPALRQRLKPPASSLRPILGLALSFFQALAWDLHREVRLGSGRAGPSRSQTGWGGPRQELQAVSFPLQPGALLGVFDDDSLREQFLANAVSQGKIAGLAGLRPLP